MKACKQCKRSDNLEMDPEQGMLVCTTCGVVAEESVVVSEVGFSENADGSSSMIGTFVGADATTARSTMSRGGITAGYGRPSREQSIAKGRQRIKQIGDCLNISGALQDQALQLYKLALDQNFTYGRRVHHVAAACLYIITRQNTLPYILLDFSDVVQVNVYKLGNIYMKLAKVLHQDTSAIDPAILLLRYAHKLEFGDETEAVAKTANRILSRMCRDWISLGRRPSGICGAALLLAGRMHSFSRSISEIVNVVRVCDATLRKRLEEFEKTETGNLKAVDFENGVDPQREEDPPAFTRGREAAAAAKAIQDGDADGDGEDIEGEMRAVMSSKDFVDAATECRSLVPVTSVVSTVRDDPDNLSDVDDDEVAAAVLTAEEADIKTRLWTDINHDYLLEMEEKRVKEERNIAMGIQPKKKRRRTTKPKSGQTAEPQDASEAFASLLETKKISKKLNYKVLEDLKKGGDLPAPGKSSSFGSIKKKAKPNPFGVDPDEDEEEEDQTTKKTAGGEGDEPENAEEEEAEGYEGAGEESLGARAALQYHGVTNYEEEDGYAYGDDTYDGYDEYE